MSAIPELTATAKSIVRAILGGRRGGAVPIGGVELGRYGSPGAPGLTPFHHRLHQMFAPGVEEFDNIGGRVIPVLQDPANHAENSTDPHSSSSTNSFQP